MLYMLFIHQPFTNKERIRQVIKLLNQILDTIIQEFPKDADDIQTKLTELYFSVDKVKESIKQQIVTLYSKSDYNKIQSHLEFSRNIDTVLEDLQSSIDTINKQHEASNAKQPIETIKTK